MSKTRKMVYVALIISQALVLHYIENLLPPLPAGARLGLANIMTLITLNIFGFKEAIAVTIIRSTLGPLLGGSPTAVIYSMSGGLLSCLVMSAIHYHAARHFSLLGLSTAGAVFHNIGQLLAASIIYGTVGIIFTYMPILQFFAVLTGNFTGLAAKYILKYLESKAFR